MTERFKTMEETAKAIGGVLSRAHHLADEKTNRVTQETRQFIKIAEEAMDGFDRTYQELLEETPKFTYTLKVIKENDFPSAVADFEKAVLWIEAHREEPVAKEFMGHYFWGLSIDPYKSEIELARLAAGLTQKQLAEMFDIPMSTVKSWGCGRRRPDKAKERLILEKLKGIKEENHA